jgi:penicillin G amidase
LKGKTNFSIPDMVAMQHDVLLRRASRQIRLLDGVHPSDPRLRDAIDLLRSWDGKIDAGSSGAALFEAWWSELSDEMYGVMVPPNLRELIPYVRTAIVLDLLEHPDKRLGPDPSAACEGLLLESLDRAVAGLESRLGVDKTKWSWGALHTVNLSHPIARWTAEGSKLLNVTGGVSGGESNTVMARWGEYPNANVTGGSSFSMVLDVGAWDNSVALNSPGQSGDPASPHYKDLYARWLDGEVFPLAFSRAKVEAETKARILLKPVQ